MIEGTADRRTAARTVDAEHPWPGLEAFAERDREFFHGRESEIEDLLRQVIRERVTLLFGRSGLGKTSLLKAGLFPACREEGLLPVYIRLDFSPDGPALRAQILAAVGLESERAEVDAPLPRDAETLWEYFHRTGADFWSPRNRLVLPLLAFDQFEEILTLGKRRQDETDAIVTELADLAEGRPPAEVKRRLDEAPEETARFSFTRHPYKILFSVREDFLPEMEGLRERIRSLAHNRMRLLRMNGDNALRVVTLGGDLVTADSAERIVRFVAASEAVDSQAPLKELEVEPALLSVVCRELNARRIQQGEARITTDLLLGTRAEILADLYEETVADLDPGVRTFVEERLLTASGFRDSMALENALAQPGVSSESLGRLVDRRLLRIEDHAGVQRVELTHDLLTGVIAASRDTRRRQEAREEAHKRAEAARLEAEEARRRLRRAQRVALLFLGLALAAVALGSWGLWERGRAIAEGRRAAEARSQAEENEREALEQKALAEAAARRAADARELAETKEVEAREEKLRAEAAARFAEEEKRRATEKEHEARAEKLKAEEAAERAREERSRAEAKEAEARAEKLRAEREEAEARRLRNLSVARALAAKTVQLQAEEQRVLAALLAVASYELESKIRGEDAIEDPDVYEALRLTRNRLALSPADPDPGSPLRERNLGILRHGSPVRAQALGAGGRWLYTGTDGGRLRRFDLKTAGYPEGGPLPGVAGSIRAIAVDSAGDRIAVAGTEGSLRLLALADPAQPETLLRAGQGPGRINSLAFRPDGGSLAAAARIQDARTGAPEGRILLWDLGEGAVGEPSEIAVSRPNVAAVGFSTDGALLAAATTSGARVWRVEDLAAPPRELCEGRDVRSLAWSSDGEHLACGEASGEVSLWSLEAGPTSDRIALQGSHESAVTSLSFGPGEPGLLASASFDGSVRIWDPARPDARPRVLTDHGNWVWGVAFSPDGQQLISVGEDKTARVITVRSEALAGEICRAAGRRLSRAEWDQYLGSDIPFEPGCAGVAGEVTSR